ncbi:MAG: HD domain-containing protein [Ktedonobacteraceae bacterium]
MELSDLIQMVASYSDAKETETLLSIAYQIASEAHHGFQRINGEPFLNHALAVATTLMEWHAPPSIVAAGLLHDIANPDYSHDYEPSTLRSRLGPKVADVVEVVIQLNSFIRHVEAGDFHSAADVQDFRNNIATYLQKEWSAIIIKVADRLHNLRTMSALTRVYQERVTGTALTLFVPLIERLGIGIARRKLEDCCFEINNATMYRLLHQHCANEAFHRSVEGVLEDLQQLATATMAGSQIRWQALSFYEMGQNVKFGKSMHNTETLPLELADAGSFIILTEDESDCYRMLGIIHKHYSPVPRQFYDFIGNPKENGYCALHTQVTHTSGNLIHVTICTHTMALIAEYGIAARWWNIAEELLPQIPAEVQHVNGEMKVFTPTGEAKYLSQRATVLDFAYHIHTDVGNHCAGALVNGTHAELYRTLQAGDKIEILQKTDITPTLDWLDYVQMPQSLNRIRQWLAQHERKAMLERGRMLLNRELQPLDTADAQVRILLAKLASNTTISQSHQTVAGAARMSSKEVLRSIEDLMVAIGVERHTPTKIADTLKRLHLKTVSSSGYVEPIVGVNVLSPEDAQLLLTFARCCEPTPPDDIVGYRRKDDILVIHKRSCGQLREPEKFVQVKWGTSQGEANYVIVVEALNHPGLASEISAVVTMLGIDMPLFTARNHPNEVMAEAYIYLGKTTLAQRTRIKNALEGKSSITKVEIIHSTFLSTPSPTEVSSKLMIHANPYGPHLAKGSRFYGRETEYNRVSALLRDRSQNAAILLWGQKRIGKTSFVLRLQEQARGDYLPIYIDVQGKQGSSTTQFLQELMSSIVKVLQDNNAGVELNLSVPHLNRLKKDPLAYFDTFMSRLRHVAQHKPLAIFFDECQCLCSLREETVSLEAIISRLRSHSQHSHGMHFILSGGGLISQLKGQCGIDALFNITYDEKLGCLEKEAARRLIKGGLAQVGNISDLAIDLLVDFTSGHPFYLQLLCSRLFEQSQEDKVKITQHFAAQSIQEWIFQTDNSRFQHFWEGHDAASARRNKLILSAIAERGTATNSIEYEQLARAISSVVPEQSLGQALIDLTSLGVLKRHHSSYSIELELFARWLRYHWPLALALQEAHWL